MNAREVFYDFTALFSAVNSSFSNNWTAENNTQLKEKGPKRSDSSIPQYHKWHVTTREKGHRLAPGRGVVLTGGGGQKKQKSPPRVSG